MEKGIKVIDEKGNIVMEFKGDALVKNPNVDSIDDFVSLIRNINYRLEKLEKSNKKSHNDISDLIDKSWSEYRRSIYQMKISKEQAISIIKEMNKYTPVTRLYYNDGKEYVQDFSYFTKNDKYMSNDLLEALKNGRTLTNEQEKELSLFKIEKQI